MNTLMYEHPLTRTQLEILEKQIGYLISGPIPKTLACGDKGTVWISRHICRRSLHLTTVTDIYDHIICQEWGQ